jgi:crotonobetainyl-CoA:carnitine CoA-transferase CaiB-like acyl-CoA transferase
LTAGPTDHPVGGTASSPPNEPALAQVENRSPGAMDRTGFTWEHIQELNPRIIFGSIKGFSEGSPYKEIAYDPALRASGTVVEVQQEKRGSYLTVGSPIKFSGFTPKITGAPLLGEHTDEVLRELGYSGEQIANMRSKKVVGSSGVSPAPRDLPQAS